MRISARLTLAGSLAIAVCACSPETPTGAAVVPSAPRHSGGVTFGSGNAVGGNASGDVVGGTATTQSVAADTGSTATGRGVTFGSGN
jgi:hypothetical protein